jgi:hypothetical protein
MGKVKLGDRSLREASARLNPVKMWPPGRPLALHTLAGVLIGSCVCRQNTGCFSDTFFAKEWAPKKWEQIEKSILLRICDSIK